MLDQLARLHEEQLVFLGVMAGMLLLAVTVLGVVVAVQVRKLRQKELELGFKDELLLRGYSVDETIRLVTSPKPCWSQGLIDLGNWAGSKLGPAAGRFFAAVCSAAQGSARSSRKLWKRSVPQLRQAQSRTEPWVRAGACRLRSGVVWFGRNADALFRCLVAPQP